MTAYIPRDQLLPTAKGLISRPATRRAGFVSKLAHAAATWAEHARARRELDGMSPSELRDIGITRGDIPRVFGPEFAREYANRGAYPAATRRR